MNKITKEFLESEIVDVTYTRLSGTLIHCAITVKNGFVFTGESACVDEASFNEEIGKKVAYEQAFGKMWFPYGFWLKAKLEVLPKDFKERLQVEYDELFERLDKLGSFLDKGKPENFDDGHWELLKEQQTHMSNYLSVLNMRMQMLNN